MKKLVILFILLLLIPLKVNSQDSNDSIEKQYLFYNEDMETIQKEQYFNKTKSFLFVPRKAKNNSFIINYLVEIYHFGNLSENENFQIRQLLKQVTNTNGLENKTLILANTDSLFGFNYINRKTKITQQNINTQKSSTDL